MVTLMFMGENNQENNYVFERKHFIYVVRETNMRQVQIIRHEKEK